MADKTAIEWAESTWSPITGCTRVSSGCLRCYAERLAATRLRDHPSRKGLTDAHGRWTGEVRWNEQWLDQPLRWRKPRRIFVCAHSDLFHESVPDEWIERVFTVMALAQRHTFQVLTKRPERMREFCEMLEHADVINMHAPTLMEHDAMPQLDDGPLPNVWLGTSVEDQPTADSRVPELKKIRAAVRWLSVEPMLGPVSLFSANGPIYESFHLKSPIGWVVCGGESGPGYRPMDPAWAYSLKRQCINRGVPFFMKQMAGKRPIPLDLRLRQWPDGGAGA